MPQPMRDITHFAIAIWRMLGVDYQKNLTYGLKSQKFRQCASAAPFGQAQKEGRRCIQAIVSKSTLKHGELNTAH